MIKDESNLDQDLINKKACIKYKFDQDPTCIDWEGKYIIGKREAQ